MKIVRYYQVVFRTDRSEPNWNRCVIEVKNRFLRFSRDLLVRYRRSWACFDGDNEGYTTKKDRRNRITGSRDNFFGSSDRVESSPDRIAKIPIRSDLSEHYLEINYTS